MDRRRRITGGAQIEIIYLLGKLLNNGFSLNNSIHCLGLKYPNLRYVFNKMTTSLNMGLSFSGNMRLLNLPEMMISQLELAEKNGLLKKVILQLGELMAIKNKQVKKIKLLMMYPLFIFMFLIMIIIFIKSFFTFDYKKSTLTFWLEFSDWFIIVAIVSSIIYLLFQFIIIRKSNEYTKVIRKIRLPIIGEIYRSYYEYNLLFSIGLIIKSGMKISDICEMKFSKKSSYFRIQKRLIHHLKLGGNIADFIRYNELMPKELEILTVSGLNHSDLGSEVLALAEIKYDETLEKVQKIITKIQPIVFGIIAILILNTYLKILVPVYGMMEGMY
ncbi:type II secretion system protein F [Companilactobacillus sp. RD055328]|uniref:type II secretion system F family protein n=1 Tax=Companilactobacillus sp. RD055328 TaxID=2916634 RepID=UPI001FC8DFD0|nr:type II secretion system F family protein [Companilactobacillus sp. RD055328]GKQ42993.1 type II secretion system protein F [Companilactobacillus sp. RD055328]